PGLPVSTLLGTRLKDDAGALKGVAVTGVTGSFGTWQYSLDGGAHWAAVGAVSDTSALLLRSTDKVRFLPDANASGTATLTFRGWDQPCGKAGARAAVSAPSPGAFFSAASDMLTLTVNAVNDRPLLGVGTSLAPFLPNSTPTMRSVSDLLGSASDVEQARA